MQMHGLRTSVTGQNKESARNLTPTHCDNVGHCEIHLQIVSGCPLDTDVNPGFESWVHDAEALP